MKLANARDYYYQRTTKASDIVRHIAFAAIALVWVFRLDTPDGPRIPSALLFPTFLVVTTLAVDLMQYVIAGILWGVFSRRKEKQREEEFKAPPWINWPALTFYYAKIVLVLWAYVLIGRFVLTSLV